MKIWFAVCMPSSSVGGVARNTRELSSGLSRLGHQCTVIDAGSAPCNFLAFSFRLLLLFAFKIGQKPDWIIGRSTDAVWCAAFARLFHLKTRTALHSHGWEEKVYEAEQRLPKACAAEGPATTWKARAIRFPLLRLTAAFGDAIFCGTIEEARWLARRHPATKGKIVCIPNGVAARPGLYWTWQTTPAIKFCAVGNITWKKNIAHAVRIFRIVKKTIPTATLTVVGSSMQELILATGFGSLDGVRAVVRENPEDMAKRYGESPFFMSTSLYEGGRSLAILEAMSFGCVVFASPIPSSIEFVKDRHNGIIVPSLSAEEDAAIVVSCVRSPALCAEVGRNAFRFSARQSWERQVGRLEKVLCNRR